MAAGAAALYEHGVLFFRDQHLSEDEQVELAHHFGEPSIYPIAKVHGATVPVCSTIIDDALAIVDGILAGG